MAKLDYYSGERQSEITSWDITITETEFIEDSDDDARDARTARIQALLDRAVPRGKELGAQKRAAEEAQRREYIKKLDRHAKEERRKHYEKLRAEFAMTDEEQANKKGG